MGIIVRIDERRHALTPSTSAGQRSGRSEDRETPVSRSIGNTNSAGTPRFDRVSQYQTWDCVVPMRSAKGFCPPATSQARFSASVVDMAEHYPDFGKNQPKTLWTTTYRNFGSSEGMKEPIDPVGFGRRVKELRKEFGWSQEKLGEASGFSQSNIGWIEQGKGKDPKKQALALAGALGSSPEWLLHGTGARQTGIRALTKEQLAAVYDELPFAVQMVITNAVKAGSTGKGKKKAS